MLRATPFVLAIAGCHAAAAPSPAPDGIPTLVEPGVVSTAEPEFAYTSTPDGREAYFNRASPDRSRLAIMVSKRTGTGWSPALTASFSGDHRDIDPYISPDGRRLFFSSDRPRPGQPRRTGFATWYLERRGSGWSEPIEAVAVNSDSSNVYSSITSDGELFFWSNRSGAGRVYSSRFGAAGWSAPVAISIPGEGGAGNPMISPSGRYLVFVRAREGRAADLWVTCRSGSGWTEPVALPEPVNSRWADFAPSFDARETTLSFTSERPGIVGPQPDSIRPPGDLYRVRWRSIAPPCR